MFLILFGVLKNERWELGKRSSRKHVRQKWLTLFGSPFLVFVFRVFSKAIIVPPNASNECQDFFKKETLQERD